MKNLFLVSVLLITTALFAQKPIKLKVCNKISKTQTTKKGTIEVIELTSEEMKNIYLSTSNENFEVTSFISGTISGKDYIEVKGEGSRLPVQMAALIKREKPKKIYLEKIIISNKNGNNIKLPPLKIIIIN